MDGPLRPSESINVYFVDITNQDFIKVISPSIDVDTMKKSVWNVCVALADAKLTIVG